MTDPATPAAGSPAAGSPAAGPPAAGTPDRPIVAIDGPSGCGKSTAARLLAERLGLPVLDTGAMYRAAALKVLESGTAPGNREAVVAVVEAAEVDVRRSAAGLEVLLDGREVGGRIRTPEVSAATSQISTYGAIRRRMVAQQRRLAARTGAVVEGRDIGSVVFPDTPHKFFLTARPKVRAERRFRELVAAGRDTTLERVLQQIDERDERDSARQDSPLLCDDSYTLIDTSDLSPEEIIERMAAQIRSQQEDGSARDR